MSEEDYQIGLQYYQNEEYEKAFQCLIKFKNEKNPEIYNALGEMYRKGLGVKQSFRKAFIYYYGSAEQGDAMGNIYVGHMYHYGYFVAKSDSEAFKYYQKAENPEGDYLVGRAYCNGEGVKKNIKQTIYHLRLAANKGYHLAQDALGQMYEWGKGVEKSYEKAFEYYQLAADQGHFGSQCCLGRLYLTGNGCEKSYEKAMEYYQLAMKKDKMAQSILEIVLSSKDNLTYCITEQFKMNSDLKRCIQEHKEEIKDLRAEIEELKLQIKYMPNGAGYQEAKEDFEELASTT